MIRYAAAGWGVGQIALQGEMLINHALPRSSAGTVPEWGLSPDRLARRLRAYFAGATDTFEDVEIDLDGLTTFQRAVVDTLRTVAYGELVTYGELAALAGHPGAQRAVGTVCAGNRFGIVVPCHRVVSATGVGPYGSLGSTYKRRLLELEGVAL